jgi:hypothetical protein
VSDEKVGPCALSGTCRSGNEGDRGRVVHLAREGFGKALCGAKPGRTSAYGFLPVDRPATCKRCLVVHSMHEAKTELDHLHTDREAAWARAHRAEVALLRALVEEVGRVRSERDAARAEIEATRARLAQVEGRLAALVEAADVANDALRDYAPGCDVYIANAETAIDDARALLARDDEKQGGAG